MNADVIINMEEPITINQDLEKIIKKKQMNADEIINMKEPITINQVTEKIIGCAYQVSNTLGGGFLEKVYENALAHELRKASLKVVQQAPIKVNYDGILVGEYIADLFVEDCVFVELKSVRSLEEIHFAQCLNYLKATGLTVCLLINFSQPKVQIRRIVNNYTGPKFATLEQ